jgi:hypothetical protein
MQLDNMRKSGEAPLCFDILVNNGLGCCARMMRFVVARRRAQELAADPEVKRLDTPAEAASRDRRAIGAWRVHKEKPRLGARASRSGPDCWDMPRTARRQECPQVGQIMASHSRAPGGCRMVRRAAAIAETPTEDNSGRPTQGPVAPRKPSSGLGRAFVTTLRSRMATCAHKEKPRLGARAERPQR